MEVALSRKSNSRSKVRSLGPALITASVVIGMMGLSRLEPGYAWFLAGGGLVALGVFFYLAGGSKR